MCGISGIINKQGITSSSLIKCTSLIRHRGPDDEGYLTWQPGEDVKIWAGLNTAPASAALHRLPILESHIRFNVGLGHRRLSILDLSPAGHQPMLYQHLSISFNGEIYNYLEVKQELITLGHHFESGTDTEVILQAWAQWGPNALHKFNGMFAMLILDQHQQKLYAVRDRFGVKPLYTTHTSGYIAFASRSKQLRILPGYHFCLNEQIAYDYLSHSHLDRGIATFENGIEQVAPGYYHEVNLQTDSTTIVQWYKLVPQPWKGTATEAFVQFKYLLKDSVKLRMRSDVPVGSALSGGLDSSTIVCLMRQVLEDQSLDNNTIETVTSCNEDKKYDEWEFAEEVINATRCNSHKVFPSFEKMTHDFNKMLWHMDYPFGGTSQFSQWCVFEGAQKAGLTVMIDGQGADEQLAGYGGNDMALYIGLMGQRKFKELMKEVLAYRNYKSSWPTNFLIGALQHHLPAKLMTAIPEKFKVFKQLPPEWLKPLHYLNNEAWPGSLAESLYRQVTMAPLPSLLRYEDRNSMAFSVESRTPFMDYRLIEFTLGLPENMVYNRGERKYILRQAYKGVVPDKILNRRDKMGFVSAEEKWVKGEGKDWFQKFVDESGKTLQNLVDPNKCESYLKKMQAGTMHFNSDPWRIICLGKWITNNA